MRTPTFLPTNLFAIRMLCKTENMAGLIGSSRTSYCIPVTIFNSIVVSCMVSCTSRSHSTEDMALTRRHPHYLSSRTHWLLFVAALSKRNQYDSLESLQILKSRWKMISGPQLESPGLYLFFQTHLSLPQKQAVLQQSTSRVPYRFGPK